LPDEQKTRRADRPPENGTANAKVIGIASLRWTPPASFWTEPITWKDPTGAITPNVRQLATGDRWLVAGANGGFVVFDLLAKTVTDHVVVNDGSVDGVAFSKVMGIAIHGDRIFASFGDGFAFAMYDFDPSTGLVIDPETMIPGVQPLQVLFDKSTGEPDDFPGAYLAGGEQVTLIQTQASPERLRLYSGSGNGNVVEIEWSEATDLMTPMSTWHNGGYFGAIARATPYKTSIPTGGMAAFGPPSLSYTIRIVVAKTMETFEIVSPPDMP
jgi:hypothetical protein